MRLDPLETYSGYRLALLKLMRITHQIKLKKLIAGKPQTTLIRNQEKEEDKANQYEEEKKQPKSIGRPKKEFITDPMEVRDIYSTKKTNEVKELVKNIQIESHNRQRSDVINKSIFRDIHNVIFNYLIYLFWLIRLGFSLFAVYTLN